MKVKQAPEDFQVEEQTSLRPSGGRFALYRLKKNGIGTPEAIEAVLRNWRIPRARVAYGGLKDRHAVTIQHFTIAGGPARHWQQDHLKVTYLGQVPRPFGPEDIAANRFAVTVRALRPPMLEAVLAVLPALVRDGLPNYFDDQRFGSVGTSNEFIARPWCAGDYERTLWLALTDANSHDSDRERAAKAVLRAHWGDWTRCQAELDRTPHWNVVAYLAQCPSDFRGAIARLRVDLRSLYLAAFQSHLWNRLLAAVLRQRCRPAQQLEIGLRMGPVPFYRDLDSAQRSEFRSLELSLPAARTKIEPGPVKELLDHELAELGLAQRQLRVKYPRDSFFSKGSRPAIFLPQNLRHFHEQDEQTPGQRKLVLRFDLPRGCYATILIKRLQIEPSLAADPD